MFIGDRGTGVGSSIKGFRKYGGKWKEKIHAESVNVCVTNENLTSQTCVFCFGLLSHPRIKKQAKNGKIYTRTINGSMYCTNPACISVIKKQAIKARDSLSALAIGLVGLTTILFGAPLPPFSSSKINNNDIENFNFKTSTFLLQEKIGTHVVGQEVRNI